MASQSQNQLLHFVMIPHIAQGHLIPMVDMARLLALHGVTVTIITTPLNAAKFNSIIDRAVESGLRISLLLVQFPYAEAGLPEGSELMDSLPSPDSFKTLILAIKLLQNPVHKLLENLDPRPSCIISDKNLAWTTDIASKLRIPRLVFDGTSCFSLLSTHNLLASKVFETIPDSEPFVVPGLPDCIKLTKSQLPGSVIMSSSSSTSSSSSAINESCKETRATELVAFGVVVNTFEELEPAYVREFKKVRTGKVWCIGPVSLCNKENSDKAERGNKAAIDGNKCLKWLDEQKPCSVVYVCLGSLSHLKAPQLIELGLGLEASNRPFIWVIKGGKNDEAEDEFAKWMVEDGFEERVKGRGLLIEGWAPQVLILSHSAIGGFLTHCGWNSTLEGVCAGLPMITWPMFAEQFYNEKLVVQVLRIGVRIGAEVALKWWEEEKDGAFMKREVVEKAIDQLMDEGDEGQERRTRAKELGVMAKMAIEEGGSSYLNMEVLIQDILQEVLCAKQQQYNAEANGDIVCVRALD